MRNYRSIKDKFRVTLGIRIRIQGLNINILSHLTSYMHGSFHLNTVTFGWGMWMDANTLIHIFAFSVLFKDQDAMGIFSCQKKGINNTL